MDNVINLADRRAANMAELTPEQEMVLESVAQKSELLSGLHAMLREYVDTVYDNCTIGMIELYAKDAIEKEIRSVPFEQAAEIIKNEFPEIACKYEKFLP